MVRVCVGFFVVAWAALGGCSSDNSGTAAASPDAGEGADAGLITCERDARDDVYAANLEKVGRAGLMKFVLVESQPAPPARGTNTWTLRIRDASDQPITGATMTAKPFMPDHGHGSSVRAVVSPEGDAYSVKPLYLFMPGVWQITFDVQAAGVSDSVVYTFCIAG